MGFYNPRVLNTSEIACPRARSMNRPITRPPQGRRTRPRELQHEGWPPRPYTAIWRIKSGLWRLSSTTRIIDSAHRRQLWYRWVVFKPCSPEVPRQRQNRWRTKERQALGLLPFKQSSSEFLCFIHAFP